MAMANESIFVCVTNVSTSVGFVYPIVPKVFSSSIPPSVPSSASTETLWSCAIFTTDFDAFIFSSNYLLAYNSLFCWICDIHL